MQTNRSRYVAAGVMLSPRSVDGRLGAQDLWFGRGLLCPFTGRPFTGLVSAGSPGAANLCPHRCRLFIWSSPKVEKGVYGFPSSDGTSMRWLLEQLDTVSDANDGPMSVPPEQVQDFYDGYVRGSLRGVKQPLSTECYLFLYGFSPDHGFVI